ncbi:hypothetical protein GX50_03485 [[Emmonsia] crescens]|uniref:Uncharacterized protein n=1 Tax=[Emmonsia] crescens TaxID=73230 RepID=A0A2B7ZKG1_9EURO|nr:hypothetical protein GX50_03485 [Emmonsia crescens]
MSASGSPLTSHLSPPCWYGWTDSKQRQTALENTTQATQPLTDSPIPMESLTPTENQTPTTDHSFSTHFAALERKPSVISQTMPNMGSSNNQGSYSQKEAALENTVQSTQPPTEHLSPPENSNLNSGSSLSEDFATAETRTMLASRTMLDAALTEGPKFYPTRELQMPRSGICAQIGLLLIALLPLLIIPAFCTVAFVGLWIPKHGGQHADALPQPVVPSVPSTQLSMTGETRTMQPTSGLPESTKVVEDPAISIYPGGVDPKGGISP